MVCYFYPSPTRSHLNINPPTRLYCAVIRMGHPHFLGDIPICSSECQRRRGNSKITINNIPFILMSIIQR